MKTYYISGKITPTLGETQAINMAKFFAAEDLLVSQGHSVFNPARLEVDGGATWEWYLARDLKYIYEEQPTLFMLTGWEASKGARLEKAFADLLELPVEFQAPTVHLPEDPSLANICDDCQ